MVILAIDPGTTESAYVVWDGRKVHEFGKVPNRELLYKLKNADFDHEGIDTFRIEMIGHYGTGMPAGKEVFYTCVWIGRMWEAISSTWGWEPELILRPTVKAHICGSAKAKDSNVRQALIDRIGPQGTKKSPGPCYGISGDVWQALAVAVTAYDLG